MEKKKSSENFKTHFSLLAVFNGGNNSKFHECDIFNQRKMKRNFLTTGYCTTPSPAPSTPIWWCFAREGWGGDISFVSKLSDW